LQQALVRPARKWRALTVIVTHFADHLSMLLMFLGHVKRLLNHAKSTMSLATTDPFATSPGPEATAARHRRAATQRVREVRDRLTSTSGTRPAFDHELLRQYAQNRLSGSLGVILLAVAIGFITSFRASDT